MTLFVASETTHTLETTITSSPPRSTLHSFPTDSTQSSFCQSSKQAIVRWGIISAGKISSDFAKAIARTDGAEVAAIASRDIHRAKLFAKNHHISTFYSSYDDLIHDTSIHVVYIGSISSEHFTIAKKCICAGKATVVEKPMTLRSTETQELIDLARKHDVFLMEGLWTRCFPAMIKLSSLLSHGIIGDVVVLQGDFGWKNMDCAYPEHRIWNPVSGGMTYDIGCYLLQFAQFAFPHGSTMDMVQVMGTTKHNVDQTVLVNGMFTTKNASSSIHMTSHPDVMICGDETLKTGMMQFYLTGSANTEERIVFQGTKGRIVLEGPAHIPTRFRVILDQGRGEKEGENRIPDKVYDFPLPDDTDTTWNYPGSIGFVYEVEAVCNCIRSNEKEYGKFNLFDSIQLSNWVERVKSQIHLYSRPESNA